MRHNVKCRSGLLGWQGRLHENYNNTFEEFQAYDETYGIAQRLGFANAESAWKANPMIQGSTNPHDLRVVRRCWHAVTDAELKRIWAACAKKGINSNGITDAILSKRYPGRLKHRMGYGWYKLVY